METRRLGAQGPVVSMLGLGGMGVSDFSSSHDDTESEATLLRALERGIPFFDTADIYGPGRDEELVGRVLSPHRAPVLGPASCSTRTPRARAASTAGPRTSSA
ncbi:aldo/keto reductase [Corallococcus sp. M34]|uniref:aldo/keto reductase n=1 Tax=Citreicoccus inhibens TaxID=2849499 RepID=UPI001C23E118|nr:aldo/keto reductase [Citreicoccus inhibens]MBU8895663.1 aldo/keto reductase [Citreicoccus inhibens]